VARAEADSIREHNLPSGNPSINIDGDASAQADALDEFAESCRLGKEV
jgi:hypothetical protein